MKYISTYFISPITSWLVLYVLFIWLKYDYYSREETINYYKVFIAETIQRRKVFKGGNYMRKYGILFWKFEWGNYSREETIQRRKLLFYVNFWHYSNYFNQLQLMLLLLKNIEILAKLWCFLKKKLLFCGEVL